MEALKILNSKNFWFTVSRVNPDKVDYVLLAFGGLLLVSYLVLWWARRTQKKKNPPLFRLWTKVAHLVGSVGFLSVLWFGLRFQYVVWLGSRFAFAVLMLLGFVWAGFILRYRLKVYPKEAEDFKRGLVKSKYLKS